LLVVPKETLELAECQVQGDDDTSEPRAVTPEAGAAYYLRKIYYGRMYEIVLSGTKDKLNASVASKLGAMMGLDLGVEAARRRFQLDVVQKAKGLKPTKDALFARDIGEIKAAYSVEDMGPAVPVLVEYRRIPGAAVEPEAPIDWTPPSAVAAAPAMQARGLRVQAANSNWTSAGITLTAGDVLIGKAEGSVSFSGWQNDADAGASGDGGLDIQVGGVVSRAGKVWTVSRQTGEVRLRVRDGKHSDNKGAYVVRLLVVPKETLELAECQVQGDDDTFTDCRKSP